MTADRPETTRAGVCRCGHGSERMISYAQGAEDVVLHRALCREGVGRYVDVGAFSPDVCSVTRHFYDVGWSGIDVEPLPEEAAELRLARPRDIVIEAALGRAAGETTIYIVGDERGLSSTEVELGEAYARAGHPVREQVVVLRTLAEVLGEYCTGEISFLKVDVEGAEAEVLEGNDWARWRPRVVLVEATKPWSHEQAHEGWEPTLLAAGYLFASFDGINRYYARSEEPDLVPLLMPATVLDDFVPESTYRIKEHARHLEEHARHLEEHVRRVEDDLRHLQAGLKARESQVAELEAGLKTRESHVAELESWAGSLEEQIHTKNLRIAELEEALHRYS